MEKKITGITESGKIVELSSTDLDRLSDKDWEVLKKKEALQRLINTHDCMSKEEILEDLKTIGVDINNL